MHSKSAMEEQSALPKTPLDFSFKKITSEIGTVVLRTAPKTNTSETLVVMMRPMGGSNDILKIKPRKNRTGKVPNIGLNNKYITSSVWLSNNSIQTTEAATAILDNILESPINIEWLDLSFNEIYDFDESFIQFRNMKILYLHGNQIVNLETVSILKDLPGLVTLTLHGNPIASIPQYRSYIIHMLPQISNLDFSPVVASERKGVQPLEFLSKIKSDKKKSTK